MENFMDTDDSRQDSGSPLIPEEDLYEAAVARANERGTAPPVNLAPRYYSLFPVSLDLLCHKGFLMICNRYFEAELCSTLSGLTLEFKEDLGKELMTNLKNECRVLYNKIHAIKDANHFLDELLVALERTAAKVLNIDLRILALDAPFYANILKQLEEIGHEYVKETSDSNVIFYVGEFEMVYSFLDSRITMSTLPDEIQKHLPRYKCDVPEAFKAFYDLVLELEDFYESLKSLDFTTWVLEPTDLHEVYRRVALKDSMSLQITFVNPLEPEEPPRLEVIGCQSSARQLQSLLKQREWMRKWNADEDILWNLQNAFGDALQFETKEKMNQDSSRVCAICYGYKLGNETPQVFCDNHRCRRAYHEACFHTWAVEQWAALGIRSSVVAPCVYCDIPILLPMA